VPIIVGAVSKSDSLEEIVRLDRNGYDIAQVIQDTIGDDTKVKYYSEGHGVYLLQWNL
jgi:hypothetical protein